jgi:hypothetical protein
MYKALLVAGKMAMAMLKMQISNYAPKWKYDGKCQVAISEVVFSHGIYEFFKERDFSD